MSEKEIVAAIKGATITIKCRQCGNNNDLLAYFAGSVCGKCARANHRKATGKGKE